MGLGPPLGEAFGSGNNGAICAHWASVNSDVGRDIRGLLGPKEDEQKQKRKNKTPYQVMKPLLGKLQEDVRNKCPEIEYLQNMADSLKHRNITSYTPSLVGAYKHRGEFSSRDFSRDFDISGLMLKLQDGSELWFEDVIEAALSFWDGYFKDNGI